MLHGVKKWMNLADLENTTAAIGPIMKSGHVIFGEESNSLCIFMSSDFFWWILDCTSRTLRTLSRLE